MDLGRYKDFLYITLAVGALFGALWVYTGVWPPMVTVQSNSMMHVDPQEYQRGDGDTLGEDVGFGRLGTLDPGDLVLIKDVERSSEIATFAHPDGTSYGQPGDVIAFSAQADGRDFTVIHRAITHVTVRTEPEVRYIVDWTDRWTEPQGAQCARDPAYTCVFNQTGVTIPEMGLFNQPLAHSGFLTKGDNVASNPGIDQAPARRGQDALKPNPVQLEEIRGTAEGELPALGLLKLAFTGETILNAEIQDHDYYLRVGNMVAPFDLWIVLVLELVAFSAAPFLWTVGRDAWRGRDAERGPELSVLQEAHRDAQGKGRAVGDVNEADREPREG